MDYHRIYTHDYFLHSDGIVSMKNRCLKFGDAFASLCYLHGITPPTKFAEWKLLHQAFPDIGEWGMNETHSYTIDDQIAFIEKYKTHTPKKILEIGCGRGEIANVLAYMGYEVVVIEPCLTVEEWVANTGEHFFNEKLNIEILQGGVRDFVNNSALDDIDAVLIVESLEHILKEDFDLLLPRIIKEFEKNNRGKLIITNWLTHHPCLIGTTPVEGEHCRHIDDEVLLEIGNQIGTIQYQEKSHLYTTFSNSKLITYLIPMKDELDQVENLISHLRSLKHPADVIRVLADSTTSEDFVNKYAHHKDVIFTRYTFINSFADMRNTGVKLCDTKWVFHIDADELPHDNLIENLHTYLLNISSETHILLVPRINHLLDLTPEIIEEYCMWPRLNSKDWWYWPDLQWRVHRTDKDIKWVDFGGVHESIDSTNYNIGESYKGDERIHPLLPTENHSLYHPKTATEWVRKEKHWATFTYNNDFEDNQLNLRKSLVESGRCDICGASRQHTCEHRIVRGVGGGKKRKYLVSVLLPTRGRPDLMLKSVKSLIEKAHHPDCIEILLKIDNDDKDTYDEAYTQLQELTPHFKILHSPRGLGYRDLHTHVNNLCGISDGEYLLLWNDDAVMETENWDNYLEEHHQGLYGDPIAVIQMDNNHHPDIFPLVHRKVYEILGHFSLNAHNDTWIHWVAELAGIERKDFRIKAFHDRFDITGNNDDDIYEGGFGADSGYAITHKLLFSEKEIRQRQNDADKILSYLRNTHEII